jgi:hypothetical protein
MKSFLTSLIFATLLFSCNKEPIKQTETTSIEVGAFQFLPMFFGSRWSYKIYDMKPTKIYKEMEYDRFDSTTQAIYSFNEKQELIAYAYWYRSGKDLNTMFSGNDRVLFNIHYIDSIRGKTYILKQDSNITQYIEGGIDTLDTKFGKVPCIVTSGETRSTHINKWRRHFGKGFGVVKYESFSIINQDTLYWKTKELDSYFINRP